MELEKQTFEGKTVGDLLKEVYEKQHETDAMVKEEITRLSDFVNTPGDAIVIIPLLRDLMDSKLKNDETLLKIVTLFKPSNQPVKQTEQGNNDFLSEKDIEQLFNEVNLQNTVTKELINNK